MAEEPTLEDLLKENIDLLENRIAIEKAALQTEKLKVIKIIQEVKDLLGMGNVMRALNDILDILNPPGDPSEPPP